MGRDAASASTAPIASRFQSPLVFIVMAIQTQQLPVAAIGWVVVVIVVPMMNGQLTKVSVREFATAATADPRIDLQRLLSIALFARCGSPAGLGHYAIQFAWVFRFHGTILFPASSIRAGCSECSTQYETRTSSPARTKSYERKAQSTAKHFPLGNWPT